MSYGTALTLSSTGLVTSSQSTLSTKNSYQIQMAQLGQRCCETGRPIMADPATGQTICSCQMKTGTHAYLSRVPTLPESIYGSATSPLFQSTALLGTEPSAFYPMPSLPTDRLPEGMKAAPPGGPNPYYIDSLLAANHYNSFYPGLDLNSAARRKNATRETTSALKAWLYEHRKNPYPTKGEKIMLAIITRMTLTQVSTWFANARRRLKKESKLNWNSKDDILDDDIDDKESKEDSMGRFSSEEEDDVLKVTSDLSDISDVDEPNTTPSSSSRKCVQRLFSPDLRDDAQPDAPLAISTNDMHPSEHNSRLPLIAGSSPSNVSQKKDNETTTATTTTNSTTGSVKSRDLNSASSNSVSGSGQAKPKIWSISEIIGCSPSTTKAASSAKCESASTSYDSPVCHHRDSDVSFRSMSSDISDSSLTSSGTPDMSIRSPLSPIRATYMSRN